MERRSDLLIQDLKDLLGTDEVYFQPSADAGLTGGEAYIFTGMQYPCFIMERSNIYQPRANDRAYLNRPSYKITYVNPDEPDPEMLNDFMEKFPTASYDRHYVSDNLHHDVWNLYY